MIIIWVAVSIAIVITAVLLTPISLHACGCLADQKNFQGEISWAGGLTSFSMVMAEGGNMFSLRLGFWRKQLHKKGSSAQKDKIKEKIKGDTREKTRETKVTHRSGNLGINNFFSRSLLRETFSFLSRAFRSLNLRLCLEGEYGAGDPALTGYLAALVGLINSSRCRLCLKPNFQEFVLNLRGEMRAHLIPGVLIFHAIGFFFAPAVRKIWWKILKSKIKRSV